MTHLHNDVLTSQDTEEMVLQLLNKERQNELEKKGEVDFSFGADGGRYRANIYKQSGKYSMALRVISTSIPSMEVLGLPKVIEQLCHTKRGLILVTGPTGSGKSTTLASMIDYVNSTRDEHILTAEDPIEYIHSHKKSIVNQREVGKDTLSFANALRAALRQDPDIILVGEMRDLDTISTAITAAETGHLVLSTLHTIGAAKTVDRIVDVFPTHQQQQVRTQLASVLQAVVSQQLLPKEGGGRVGAFEIMVTNSALSNLIREGKTHQMQSIIQTGKAQGMQTMDNCLKDLFRQGTISFESLKKYAVDFDSIARELGF